MQDTPISWARYVQENRKMRFLEAYEGWGQGRSTQAEAALLLGQCERSFRRHIERYEEDGMEGLLATALSTAGQYMVEASLGPGVDVMTGHWEFTYGEQSNNWGQTLIDSR